MAALTGGAVSSMSELPLQCINPQYGTHSVACGGQDLARWAGPVREHGHFGVPVVLLDHPIPCLGFGFWGLLFGFWSLGFGVVCSVFRGLSSGFGLWASHLCLSLGLGFGVLGLGVWFWGSGFGVWGVWFSVQSSGSSSLHPLQPIHYAEVSRS